MNDRKTTVLTKEYYGSELEQAYAKILNGWVDGSLNDGGKDVRLNDKSIRAIQVKSTIRDACKSAAMSQIRHKFIPICVGQPGTYEEVYYALLEDGIWIEKGLANREKAIEVISQIRRQLCSL